MNTLIIGGGYLSTVLSGHFTQQGHAVTVIDFPTIDITNMTSVRSALESHRPDLVINAAAFTDTNAAEKPENQGKVYAINVQGPANIAYIAREMKLPWIHFSTAMMFDGSNADQGWSEEALPHPTNYYSWTKLWADEQIEKFAAEDRIYILRIHTPISSLSHARNFMNRMQLFDKAIDIPTSITVVEDLCTVIDHCVSNQLPGGVYNAVNTGTISAFKIAKLMQEGGLIAADKQLTPLTREELDAMTLAKGGAHQTFPILSTEKLSQHGLTLPTAEIAIRQTISNFHE